MSIMPFGNVVRATGPRVTLVVGVSVGGTNRSVRPAQGSGSSLVADFGAAFFSAAGIAGLDAGGGGGDFAGACANATDDESINAAASAWLTAGSCWRLISSLR